MTPIFRYLLFGLLFLLAGCISDPAEIQSPQSESESDVGAQEATNDTTQDADSECIPTDCEAFGATCGQPDDGCGNLLECGTCEEGEQCNSFVCECTVSEEEVCTANGAYCGELTVRDRCGQERIVDCGGCDDGVECGLVADNQCCTRLTCDDIDQKCGQHPHPDPQCDAIIECDDCDNGTFCSPDEDDSETFVCQDDFCTPLTTNDCDEDACGILNNPDGCGGLINCGICPGLTSFCIAGTCT